jgi:dihydrofolate reductase
LKEDLIDKMTITTIPYLLRGGVPLFTEFPERIDFECVASNLFLGKIVQNRFVRKR